MKTRSVQLYPSPENCQRTNDDTIPFDFAAAMLTQIVKQVPAAERAGLVIAGWTSLRLVNPAHVLSQAEIDAERWAMLATALRDAARDGLTADQVKELRNKLGVV